MTHELSRRALLKAAGAAAIAGSAKGALAQGSPDVPFVVDLEAVRRLAASLPGPLPVALNNVSVAASIRPRKFVVEGGDGTPVTMPRTAYQIVYPDGPVMLDSGLDMPTHASFSPDRPEPFFPDEFTRLKKALDTARLIVLTHFHADHVGGVVTAANFAELAAKTLATPHTLQIMQDAPHRPHLKLNAQQAGLFQKLEYGAMTAVAPGLVMLKAPGHSADMQMAYIRLRSGQEFFHSIDAAWVVDNIAELKGKAAPWVKEDTAQIGGQLRFLKTLMADEPKVTVLVTHDQIQFDALRRDGVAGPLQV